MFFLKKTFNTMFQYVLFVIKGKAVLTFKFFLNL